MGVLRRNDDGHGQGILGQDMFFGQAGQIQNDEAESVAVLSSPTKEPVVGVGFASPDQPIADNTEASDDSSSDGSKSKSSLYMQRRNSIRTRNISYQSVQNMKEFYRHMDREKQFEDNEALARPPKEDPLWIRKGDEQRSTSAAESRAAALDSSLVTPRTTRRPPLRRPGMSTVWASTS